MLAHPHSGCLDLFYVQRDGVWYAVSPAPRSDRWHYWQSCDQQDEDGRPEWAAEEQEEICFSWDNAESLTYFFARKAK